MTASGRDDSRYEASKRRPQAQDDVAALYREIDFYLVLYLYFHALYLRVVSVLRLLVAVVDHEVDDEDHQEGRERQQEDAPAYIEGNDTALAQQRHDLEEDEYQKALSNIF